MLVLTTSRITRLNATFEVVAGAAGIALYSGREGQSDACIFAPSRNSNQRNFLSKLSEGVLRHEGLKFPALGLIWSMSNPRDLLHLHILSFLRAYWPRFQFKARKASLRYVDSFHSNLRGKDEGINV
jgi:hypothetical protein